MSSDSANLSLQVTASIWVNTSRWLIEKNNIRVAHDSDSEADLALVATAQVADLLVAVNAQSQIRDDVLDESSALGTVNTSDGGEVPESLLNGHLTNKLSVLWAVANHAFDNVKVLGNFVAANENLTVAGLNFI